MNKTFSGNDDAYLHLVGYTKMKHPGPLILLGKRGLGKRKAAISLAAHLLQCPEESLRKNKDFILLDKGNEPVRVEDILPLLERSSIAPLGAVKVYLICRADKINSQAQNKLLKLLEDRNRTNIVVFLCEQDVLLATIKSRCITVSFYPLTDTQMNAFLKDNGIEDTCFFSYLCDNCPYRIQEVQTVYPALKDTFSKILTVKRREELLHVFHLIQEKDTEAFYSIHAEHYLTALQMLQYLFYSLLMTQINSRSGIIPDKPEIYDSLSGLYNIRDTHAICTAIAFHQKQWLSGVYSKNDFFDLVRTMINPNSIKGGYYAL